MNRRLPPPRPCKQHRPLWLLEGTARLPGPPGSGFCPEAVISVISSHVEELLENKKNGFSEGCEPSSEPERSPVFNLSGGHISGHDLACLKWSVPI